MKQLATTSLQKLSFLLVTKKPKSLKQSVLVNAQYEASVWITHFNTKRRMAYGVALLKKSAVRLFAGAVAQPNIEKVPLISYAVTVQIAAL